MNEPVADFTLFPGVCPSWDNAPRKRLGAVTFINSTPAKYAEWLAWACRRVIQVNPPAERIVFINAWNEWAEGAHLEPDRHFGYAYLKATADTLAGLAGGSATTQNSVIGDGVNNLEWGQRNIVARVKSGFSWLKPLLIWRRKSNVRRF
jgi:hypothetical protein